MFNIPAILSKHAESCFNINYGSQRGTCFLYYSSNISYFVTAAHVVKGLTVGDNILFNNVAGLVPFRVRGVEFDSSGHDICIFSLDGFGVIGDGKSRSNAQLALASPLVYVGFPHGLVGDYPSQHGFKTGLTKVAFYSGNVIINNLGIMVLDGINNPGFSGGPVYASDQKGLATLCAVISGYRFEKESQGQLFKKNGQVSVPVPDHFVKLNSGIIYATPIGIVDALAKKLNSGNDFRLKV